MKFILILLSALVWQNSYSQPETDIWLMNISYKKGKINLSEPRNITAKKGYENQPAFYNSFEVYYTSQPPGTMQTDIYKFDIRTGKTEQVTFSSTSEYSSGWRPGNRALSVLMVEKDSTQRIWQYSNESKLPSVLFPGRDSIGYYAWIDRNSVIAYILSDNKNQPSRISLVQDAGKEKVLAENVARGLRVYGKSAFYIKTEDSLQFLYTTDFNTSMKLVKTPGRSIDLEIFQDFVLMANEGTIYAARIFRRNKKITSLSEFFSIQDLSGIGLKKISRLAISSDGKTLAIVNSQ